MLPVSDTLAYQQFKARQAAARLVASVPPASVAPARILVRDTDNIRTSVNLSPQAGSNLARAFC